MRTPYIQLFSCCRMTSTNFQIGLPDSKSSSRVLRPPGGGHTDIFGVHGDNIDVKTPLKQNKHGQSSIGSLFQDDSKPNGTTDVKDQKESKIVPEENTNLESATVTDENTIPDSESVTDENTKPAPEPEKKLDDEVDMKKVATPMRRRVPPGGFCTALW